MGVLAKNNRQLIYIYSEDSDLGKKLLPYIDGIKKSTRIININKEKISDTVWMEIVGMLKTPLREILSKKYINSSETTENTDYNENDWLKIINHHPELLQNPIIISNSKACVVNSLKNVQDFFTAAGSSFDKSPQAIKNGNHKRAYKNVS